MLVRAEIGAVRLFFENGEIEIADAGFLIIAVLPRAKDIRRAGIRRQLVLQDVGIAPVGVRELVGRVHIKQEQPAGVKIVVNGPKAGQQFSVRQQVIEAVQTAGDRADRSVQLKGAHILLKKERSGALRLGSVSYRQHIGASVHTDHIVAAPRQLMRHPPGSAGKIQNQLRLLRKPAGKARFEKIRPSGVSDFPVQKIIHPRQCAVAFTSAHGLSCSACFRRFRTVR